MVGWVGFGYVLSTRGKFLVSTHGLYYTCFQYWGRYGQCAADLVPPQTLILSFAFLFSPVLSLTLHLVDCVLECDCTEAEQPLW